MCFFIPIIESRIADVYIKLCECPLIKAKEPIIFKLQKNYYFIHHSLTMVRECIYKVLYNICSTMVHRAREMTESDAVTTHRSMLPPAVVSPAVPCPRVSLICVCRWSPILGCLPTVSVWSIFLSLLIQRKIVHSFNRAHCFCDNI